MNGAKVLDLGYDSFPFPCLLDLYIKTRILNHLLIDSLSSKLVVALATGS